MLPVFSAGESGGCPHSGLAGSAGDCRVSMGLPVDGAVLRFGRLPAGQGRPW